MNNKNHDIFLEFKKNNKWVLTDLKKTLLGHFATWDPMIKIGIENNIAHQFTSQILIYSKFVVYLDKNWKYEVNNNETYQLLNAILWGLIKEMTIIFNNLIDWNIKNKKINIDKTISIFIKKFRNILLHSQIDRISFNELFISINKINNTIKDAQLKNHLSRLLKKGSAIFSNNVDQRDYISICKHNIKDIEKLNGNKNIADSDFSLISNAYLLKIAKKPIEYFSTRFLIETLKNEGELNLADIFICYVQFNENIVIRIKMFEILYFLIENLSGYLMQVI